MGPRISEWHGKLAAQVPQASSDMSMTSLHFDKAKTEAPVEFWADRLVYSYTDTLTLRPKNHIVLLGLYNILY